MYFKIYFIAFITLCLKYSLADPLEEFKHRFVNFILDCTADYPVSSAEIQTLRQKQLPDSQNVKCLLACGYKKIGMMDNDGKLSDEGIQKISNELFADQPDLIRRSKEFTNACEFVNDEEINGDEKECERAGMIFKCSIEKAAQFDLVA